MPNRLLTPEESADRLKDIWDANMKPLIAQKRAEGASEEELLEIGNMALAYMFGGLWGFPDNG